MQVLVAAVHHVVKEGLVALVHRDRLQDVEVHVVLDQALRVLRRAVEVHEARVDRVLGISDAERAADDLLVLADGAERATFERRRLDSVDDETRDLGKACSRRERRSLGRRRRPGACDERDRQQDRSLLHDQTSLKPQG